jgi:hypothetical protein
MASTHAVSVVLVHGGFVDGSGWEGVYKILRTNGYDVSVVQPRRCRLQATWRPSSSSLLHRVGP